MEELEPCSDAWNRKWKSSKKVRGLESGMEEFELSSRLVIGNGGFRVKFDTWNRQRRSLNQVSTLGIGNARVRGKFDAWNREWRSSNQVSTLGIGNGGIRAKFEAWNRK